MEYRKYKTELHCHSKEVSPCANEPAENIVEKYVRYGYSTIVLTNHLSRFAMDSAVPNGTWREKAEFFIDGYRKLKKAAEGKLNILLGAEIRFPQHNNDYVIYGLTEEFLLSHENVYDTDVFTFHDNTWQDIITIQAHPFRCNQHIIFPWCVDGWEVYNGHPDQNSANEAAKAYAATHPGRIYTSGTDHHDDNHFPAGGIITDFEIKTNKQLLNVLRGGYYTLIEEEDIRLGKKRL